MMHIGPYRLLTRRLPLLFLDDWYGGGAREALSSSYPRVMR